MTDKEIKNQALSLVKKGLKAMAPQFEAALPAHVTPEKFTRVALMAIQGNDYLLNANRNSLYTACVRCATDGLLPDSREAAFVVFGQEVVYLPMWQGILKMVRNSGDLKSISAYCVYEKDHFEYELGDKEQVTHRPYLGSDRGPIVMTYCIAHTNDGGIYREFMDEDAINAVKSISRTGSRNKGPWRDWPEQMRKKSVIMRISKRLPMSTDMAEFIDPDFPTIINGNRSQISQPEVEQDKEPSRLKEAMGIDNAENEILIDGGSTTL